ncbi:SMP-30/gluconolactonase/LRE family protein [Nocardioides sp. cx-169]|uniref:SMP-30/gluconolactonase/LRE family protein n=1 Tax=Nocardioides sp. cx-169 TaxID=2899080 RepID=UPI001E3C533D|nr:SMP-30/gluconolactonase/LRE family protein [Nocardioides sp. cx-169]MCD4536602.1 SMP-30/gluconolactonase/LRE family protein [Nocardioides sp. cx-169]
MSRTITTISSGHTILEGPRWHEGRLWCSDLYANRVLSMAENGTDQRIEAELGDHPSGLGWLPDGRLLIVSMTEHKLLRREPDGEIVTHADLGDFVQGYANDMVVDARGRAFVGNSGFAVFADEPFVPGSVVRVDPDGRVEVAAEDMWFPNGSVFLPDGTLLVGETVGNRITAFDVADDGSLAERRAWATFGDPPEPTERSFGNAMSFMGVAADGCALDADQALWIADCGGNRVVRVRAGGEILEEVSMGATTLACALGGDDGRTLFVCTVPSSNNAELVTVRVDVPASPHQTA